MSTTMTIETPRLQLVLESTEATLAKINALSAEERAMVSPAWLERVRSSPMASPWTHSFTMIERESGTAVGTCEFKGPPDDDGRVEIAYAVEPAFQGRGYAMESARALTMYARDVHDVRTVCAHTAPCEGPSTSVLRASGFEYIGDVVDPEDGLVWRWEYVPT